MRSRPFLGRLKARLGPRGFLEVPCGPSKARQRRGSLAHTLLVYYVPTDRILLSCYILPCAIYARGVL